MRTLEKDELYGKYHVLLYGVSILLDKKWERKFQIERKPAFQLKESPCFGRMILRSMRRETLYGDGVQIKKYSQNKIFPSFLAFRLYLTRTLMLAV